MINVNDYRGKRALVTGSEGFVGKHLVKRLRALGAAVHGMDTLDPRRIGDVRDPVRCLWAVGDVQPDFVFHLAAQAFVPLGYKDPRGTWETNVGGTVNLLDAIRWKLSGAPRAVVVVTTDKVYGDTGRNSPIRQIDALGGFAHEGDELRGICPYSASKVAAEHVVASYRESFWPMGPVRVAAARSGNIIGPGDHFGVGRLVPNAIEALRTGKPVPVYNPFAVRPWQYVADVVEGYLLLGLALYTGETADGSRPGDLFPGVNFGPEQHHTVQEVVDEVVKCWGSGSSVLTPSKLREVQHLRINSSKARRMLGWTQGYSFEEGIRATVQWYRNNAADRDTEMPA